MKVILGFVLVVFGGVLLARALWEKRDIPVTIHISYNSLTDGKSKYYDAATGRYFVTGTSGGEVWVCEVSSEYWEYVKENTHVSIPRSKCRVIEP